MPLKSLGSNPDSSSRPESEYPPIIIQNINSAQQEQIKRYPATKLTLNLSGATVLPHNFQNLEMSPSNRQIVNFNRAHPPMTLIKASLGSTGDLHAFSSVSSLQNTIAASDGSMNFRINLPQL